MEGVNFTLDSFSLLFQGFSLVWFHVFCQVPVNDSLDDGV